MSPLKRFSVAMPVTVIDDGPVSLVTFKDWGSFSASSFHASLLHSGDRWCGVLGFVPAVSVESVSSSSTPFTSSDLSWGGLKITAVWIVNPGWSMVTYRKKKVMSWGWNWRSPERVSARERNWGEGKTEPPGLWSRRQRGKRLESSLRIVYTTLARLCLVAGYADTTYPHHGTRVKRLFFFFKLLNVIL